MERNRGERVRGLHARPRAATPNSDLTAVLNLPLIADTLAVRGVIYNDRRGGYINERAGHFHSQGERSWHRLRSVSDGLRPNTTPCQVRLTASHQ